MRRKLTHERRSPDFKLVPKPVNFVLKVLGKIESHFGGSPLFGTSIVAVFRKHNGYNSFDGPTREKAVQVGLTNVDDRVNMANNFSVPLSPSVL